jgi:hypothetical protein
MTFGHGQVCFRYYNSVAFRRTKHNATYQTLEGGSSDDNRNMSCYIMSYHVTTCNVVFVFDYILH